MIIDELVVHNFGPFAERQKISLTPPTPQQPIVLFGGLNGHGKTTLLEAIQLCFYGALSGNAGRSGLSYNDYLAACVHRNSGLKEAAVEIAFRHTIDGEENRFRIHRSWRVGARGCREHFEVLKNRRREEALAENWPTEVENLFPPNIAGLFLFDGEQIEQYANPERSTELIGTAIRNLLGLDIVDQLGKDLVVYSRRKRMEEKDDPVRTNIEDADRQLAKLDVQIDALKEERREVEEQNLNGLRKKLEVLETEYRQVGGELYEERIQIEQELIESEKQLGEDVERLRLSAAGELPLLLVREILYAVQAQDGLEEDSRRSRELTSVLCNRDQELIKELQRRNIGEANIRAISAWLDASRATHSTPENVTEVVQLSPTARSDLLSLIDGGIDDLADRVTTELTNEAIAVTRTENIRLKHESVPSSDLIGEVIRKRDVTRTEVSILEDRLDRMDDDLARFVGERERKHKALIRLVEEEARAAGVREDRARILDHVGRVRKTLTVFRQSVIERHVTRIAALVLGSYQQLLRKASLVTRLEIDPKSFELTLFGNDGNRIGADRLSAGERQLLAIALLWGLGKASGRALPTAIDTPLGRLDASHRRFLVQRYFPLASHQVLLLSTDEEIAGKYFDELRPYVGRCYSLSYEDSTASTNISNGYFEGHMLN